jgi:hypothetical protein
MRIYDPRVGRFLSVDPIGKDYPMLTPYQFASNTPIKAIDLDGLEAAIVNYGYRVTALIVTGSINVGAGIDISGDVKIFNSWSAGVGLGAFAGGGLSASIYPTATIGQVMGGGINYGGNIGIPGISLGGDLNFSLQTTGTGTNQKINDFKFGLSGGLKPFSAGPGGAEFHMDYSSTSPILEFNIKDIPKDINSLLKDKLGFNEDETNKFLDYIKSTSHELNKLKDKEQKSENKDKKTDKPNSTQSKKIDNSKKNEPKTHSSRGSNPKAK